MEQWIHASDDLCAILSDYSACIMIRAKCDSIKQVMACLALHVHKDELMSGFSLEGEVVLRKPNKPSAEQQ